MTIQISQAQPGPGNFLLSLMMHTWEKGKITESDEILRTRLYNIDECGDTDPLVWAEHLCDEVYKRVNEIRAERADTGWISGSGAIEQSASETVTPEV
jgi:hypothetical protein